MSFFKKIDNILAGLGNMKAMRRVHVDTYTENRINNISSEKFAESQHGILHIDFQELAGYHFINTTIITRLDLSTKKYINIEFLADEDGFEVNSDSRIIESDFSNVSSKYITQVDFCLTEEQIKSVKRREFNMVKIISKKKILLLNKHDF